MDAAPGGCGATGQLIPRSQVPPFLDSHPGGGKVVETPTSMTRALQDLPGEEAGLATPSMNLVSGTSNAGRSPRPQFMPAASSTSIQSAVMNTAGRDIHVNNITHNYGNALKANNDDLPATEVDEMLRWIDDPTDGFVDVYEKVLEERMEGTGAWFLESDDFKNFVGRKGAVLWGTGLPGAGKTFLSGTTREEIGRLFENREDVAVAHVFHRHSDTYSVRDVYASILSQIVVENPTATAILAPHLAQSRRRTRKEPRKPLTKDVLRLLKEVVSHFEKVFIVVDGLDEAPDEVKDSLLQDLPPMGPNLLIMSRPLPHHMARIPDTIHVDIQARTADIALFIRDKVDRSGDLAALLQGKEDLVQKLIDLVNEKSQGMFLVAHLQMEAAMEEADTVQSLYKTLDDLPSGVDELYDLAMVRIQGQGAKYAAVARRALFFLFHAVDRLSVEDIQHALSASFGYSPFGDSAGLTPVPLIVSKCCGLLEIRRRQTRYTLAWTEKQFDEIQFTHYTAKEYIRKIDFTEPIHPQSLLSGACTAAIMAHLHVLEPLNGQVDRFAYTESQPLLSYALRYWTHHTHMSSYQGSLHPNVLALLEQDPRVSDLGDYGFSPRRGDSESALFVPNGLHLAAMHGFTEIINSGRLEYLADPIYGYTPTHLAAMYDRAEALRALLRVSYRVNELTARKQTALHLAIYRGASRDIHQLLGTLDVLLSSPSIDVNIQDEDGYTALMYAIMEPDPLVCEAAVPALLSHPNIDLNIRDSRGKTALMHANAMSEERRLLVVEKLLGQQNIDCNIGDDSGRTPLLEAFSNGDLDVIHAILKKDPLDINDQDHLGNTPLMYAARLQPADEDDEELFNTILWTLISYPELDLNAQNTRQETALLVACMGANVTVTHALLPALLQHPQIDVNVRDIQGRTALMCAISSADNQATKVRYLLSNPGVDCNVPNRYGRTPLMEACILENEKVVEVLLEHGSVDLARADADGLTAFDWAALSPAILDILYLHLSVNGA